MRYSVDFHFGVFLYFLQKSTRMHASEYNVIKQHRNKHKLKTSLSKLKTANWKQYPFGSELSLLREFANLFFSSSLFSFSIFFALVLVSKVRYSNLPNLKKRNGKHGMLWKLFKSLTRKERKWKRKRKTYAKTKFNVCGFKVDSSKRKFSRTIAINSSSAILLRAFVIFCNLFCTYFAVLISN